MQAGRPIKRRHPMATPHHLLLPLGACVCAFRTDFLKAGTLAKGSAETGEVESYMCAKVKRSPIASPSCAEYLGYFVVGERSGAERPLCGHACMHACMLLLLPRRGPMRHWPACGWRSALATDELQGKARQGALPAPSLAEPTRGAKEAASPLYLWASQSVVCARCAAADGRRSLSHHDAVLS